MDVRKNSDPGLNRTHIGGGEGVWGRAGESLTKDFPGPPPENLILIGTVHGDPHGYVRAGKLLDHLRPDLVTVEISPFSLRYRQQHGPRWQRQLARVLAEMPPAAASHLAIQRLAAQVAMPFEVQAARDYRRQSGVPWRPLDLGAPARCHLPRYAPELLSPGNLKVLLTTADGSLEEYIAAEFRRARLALARDPRHLFPLSNHETLRRERVLARRLRRLAGRYQQVVHLGGWEHLVGWHDSPSLWHGVADLNPRRMLLDEADRLLAE